MRKVIISIGILFILNGCSVMPYHNKFMCEGGGNIKVCKRVSDILQQDDEINANTTKTKIKYINCPYNPKYPYYKPFKDCIKTQEKILKEDRKLKNMIEAISLEELQKPIKVEVECKNYKTSSNQENYVPLNKNVEVCVYNANIRERPNCKAKILKIVKKGTKIYAIALVDKAWIKLKNGYIHKSLVCNECLLKEGK